MKNASEMLDGAKKIGGKALSLLLIAILTACSGGKPVSELTGIDFLNCETADKANMSVDLPADSTMSVDGATLTTLSNGSLSVDGKTDVAPDGTITFHESNQDLTFKGSPGAGKMTHIDITGTCIRQAAPTPTTPRMTPTPHGFNNSHS